MQSVPGLPCIWHAVPELADRFGLPLDVPEEITDMQEAAVKQRKAPRTKRERPPPPERVQPPPVCPVFEISIVVVFCWKPSGDPQSQGNSGWVQDYNEEVLTQLTAPNLHQTLLGHGCGLPWLCSRFFFRDVPRLRRGGGNAVHRWSRPSPSQC